MKKSLKSLHTLMIDKIITMEEYIVILDAIHQEMEDKMALVWFYPKFLRRIFYNQIGSTAVSRITGDALHLLGDMIIEKYSTK